MSPRPDLRNVESRFRAQQRDGSFPGGQLVVQRDGELLLDLAVGTARGLRPGEEPLAVQPHTRFQVMSASKAVVGVLVAALEDRGQLDVTAPVARYVPGFAQNGKADITVLDVLTHRSGIELPALKQDFPAWADPAAVRSAVLGCRPLHPRGAIAYGPQEFGWILGELCRCITGRTLAELLPELLPPELHGLRFQLAAAELPAVARTYWLGRPHLRLGGIDLAAGFEASNNAPTTLTALVPGASMLTTARDLAAFYAFLLRGGVDLRGRRCIAEATLRRYTDEAVRGRDRVTGVPIVLGRGFARGWLLPGPFGLWGSGGCYGHAGGFAVVAFADPRARAAVAMVTNGNRSVGDMVRRFAPLGTAIRSALRGT